MSAAPRSTQVVSTIYLSYSPIEIDPLPDSSWVDKIIPTPCDLGLPLQKLGIKKGILGYHGSGVYLALILLI
jgi:hypothetical protein